MGKKVPFHVDTMVLHTGVTGSVILLVIKLPSREVIRIVVDCGLFQEKVYEELNGFLPFNSKNIDYVLVTHGHTDHIGKLPLMVKEGYYKPIYATEDTCKIMPISLGDTYKLLKTAAKIKNTKCIYRDIDVDNTIKLAKPCKFNKTINLGGYVKATFFQNGHLIGASSILLQISYPGQEDINLFFTGDYNTKNKFFDVEPLPEWVKKLPITVVQEATYGTTEASDIKECFRENVIKAVKEGQTIVAPVLSLGRSQEIMYELKLMQDEGLLPKKIPIYLDGKLALKYTELYLKGEFKIKEEMRDFLPENISFVTDSQRDQLVHSKKQKIILTTSGMGSHGPAQVYIPEYVTRSKALIHFTCYTAEDTLGRKLKDGNKGDILNANGLMVKKEADVEYTSEFSSHAKADEMIDFLKRFKNLRLVLVNHGEPKVKEAFAERILHQTECKKVCILEKDYGYRVNHYGLVKALITHF